MQTRRAVRQAAMDIAEKSKNKPGVSPLPREKASDGQSAQESGLRTLVGEENSDVEANDSEDTASLQGDVEG